MQELRGNIRVFCRARPPSLRELERGAASDGAVCVEFPDSGVIKVENDRNKEKTWEFDQTFDFHSSQEQVRAARSARAFCTESVSSYVFFGERPRTFYRTSTRATFFEPPNRKPT